MNAFDWSLPLFRVAGIQVRVHWSLWLVLLYDVWRSQQGMAEHGAWLWAFYFLALFGSVLLHEFGHALAARSVGGDCRRIELWALGGLAHADVPMRPWPQFATAAAGPLVSAVLAIGCTGAVAVGEAGGYLHGMPLTTACLSYLGFVNLRLLLFNLMPVHPLDGGQMLRAVLWPMIGLRRATKWTLLVAIPAVIALLLWGASNDDWMIIGIGIWMLFRVVQEYTLHRLGQFEEESWRTPERGDGWWTRWKRERARKAAERRERAEQEEQDLVDRLLAKVGEHGLPSLTKQERATLEAYSRKQREKQEIGR